MVSGFDDALEHVLEDTERGVLCDLDATGDALLIAFGGLYGELLIAPFEFFNLLQDVPVKRVFLRDLDRSWYQQGVRGVAATVDGTASWLRSIVRESGATRVVTLGTSAGGFAALLFGALLGASEAHAFSPQTTVTRRHRLRYRDTRWHHDIVAMRRATHDRPTYLDVRPVLAAAPASTTRYHVYYGTKERGDVPHATRLEGLPGVTLHAYPRGHRLVKHLRDSGELAEILHRAVGVDDAPSAGPATTPAA
jgi:hypothetical protein